MKSAVNQEYLGFSFTMKLCRHVPKDCIFKSSTNSRLIKKTLLELPQKGFQLRLCKEIIQGFFFFLKDHLGKDHEVNLQ